MVNYVQRCIHDYEDSEPDEGFRLRLDFIERDIEQITECGTRERALLHLRKVRDFAFFYMKDKHHRDEATNATRTAVINELKGLLDYLRSAGIK
jgi:hypothetical protein